MHYYWDVPQDTIDSIDYWWGLLERDPEAAGVLAEAEAILAAHQKQIRSVQNASDGGE